MQRSTESTANSTRLVIQIWRHNLRSSTWSRAWFETLVTLHSCHSILECNHVLGRHNKRTRMCHISFCSGQKCRSNVARSLFTWLLSLSRWCSDGWWRTDDKAIVVTSITIRTSNSDTHKFRLRQPPIRLGTAESMETKSALKQTAARASTFECCRR